MQSRPNYFSTNIYVLAAFFVNNFDWNCHFFENCRRITTDGAKTFTGKQIGRNSALYFTPYLSTALSKVLPTAPFKNNKKY